MPPCVKPLGHFENWKELERINISMEHIVVVVREVFFENQAVNHVCRECWIETKIHEQSPHS